MNLSLVAVEGCTVSYTPFPGWSMVKREDFKVNTMTISGKKPLYKLEFKFKDSSAQPTYMDLAITPGNTALRVSGQKLLRVGDSAGTASSPPGRVEITAAGQSILKCGDA